MTKTEKQVKQSKAAHKRIRIQLTGYDKSVLDCSVGDIVETAKRTGAVVIGPIPLPTKIEKYTVLRSPHVDRKSREQFEMRTHKRLVDIMATPTTVDALKGVMLPAGVGIKIRAA